MTENDHINSIVFCEMSNSLIYKVFCNCTVCMVSTFLLFIFIVNTIIHNV